MINPNRAGANHPADSGVNSLTWNFATSQALFEGRA